MADGNIIPLELELLGAWDIADATVLLQLAFNMPRPYGDDLKRHLAMDPASWWLGPAGDRCGAPSRKTARRSLPWTHR